MALRFANKIHCIVNNVMAQGLRLQAHALKASAPPPKTRYPLNQQDANTYIEQLKARAFASQAVDANEPDVVRTFNVDVHCRTASKPPQQQDAVQPPAGANFGLAQRFLATTAAGKDGKPFAKTSLCGGKKKKVKVECKKGPAADASKCPKLENNDGCPKFKIENCEAAKDISCTKRKFIFTDCQKTPAPYPAFSEACYEPLPPTISECKDCPYRQDNHPTFKGPMNKFAGASEAAQGAKGQKRKLHSDARRLVTLRFGESRKTEKQQREEELQKRLYDELNKSVFEAKHERARRLPADDAVKVGPALNATLAADLYRRLLHLKLIADRPSAVNAQHWEMLLEGPGWRHQLGNSRAHKLRRKVPNHPCDRCPRFNYKYKDYDIKGKQRRYRKATRKEKERQEEDCQECRTGASPVASMELAPKGRNMDQHKDMPHHKRHRLGDRRRHRLRDKTQYPECISNQCEILPFKPPEDYDMVEEKKKRDKKGKCDCAGASVVDHPLAMWCKKVPRKPKKGDTSLECDELAPSEVCPKTLLDRKPYPKYRKAAKKRLAKEKKLNEKRKAAKHAKELAKKRMKKPPPKSAAGVGVEEAVGFMQAPVCSQERLASCN